MVRVSGYRLGKPDIREKNSENRAPLSCLSGFDGVTRPRPLASRHFLPIHPAIEISPFQKLGKTPETHPKTSKSRFPLKKHEWKAANLIMKKKKLDEWGGILVEVSNGDGIPGSLYLLVVLMNHHQ